MPPTVGPSLNIEQGVLMGRRQVAQRSQAGTGGGILALGYHMHGGVLVDCWAVKRSEISDSQLRIEISWSLPDILEIKMPGTLK